MATGQFILRADADGGGCACDTLRFCVDILEDSIPAFLKDTGKSSWEPFRTFRTCQSSGYYDPIAAPHLLDTRTTSWRRTPHARSRCPLKLHRVGSRITPNTKPAACLSGAYRLPPLRALCRSLLHASRCGETDNNLSPFSSRARLWSFIQVQRTICNESTTNDAGAGGRSAPGHHPRQSHPFMAAWRLSLGRRAHGRHRGATYTRDTLVPSLHRFETGSWAGSLGVDHDVRRLQGLCTGRIGVEPAATTAEA